MQVGSILFENPSPFQIHYQLQYAIFKFVRFDNHLSERPMARTDSPLSCTRSLDIPPPYALTLLRMIDVRSRVLPERPYTTNSCSNEQIELRPEPGNQYAESLPNRGTPGNNRRFGEIDHRIV